MSDIQIKNFSFVEIKKILTKPKYIPGTYVQFIEVEYLIENQIKRGKVFNNDYDIEYLSEGDIVLMKEG